MNKKEKEKIKFEVVYEAAEVLKVGELMSKFDLGIVGISYPQCMDVSWTTTTKIDKKYIAKMRKALRQAFEHDGSKVISIRLKKSNKTE